MSCTDDLNSIDAGREKVRETQVLFEEPVKDLDAPAVSVLMYYLHGRCFGLIRYKDHLRLISASFCTGHRPGPCLPESYPYNPKRSVVMFRSRRSVE